MVDLGSLSDPPQMSTLLNPVQRALAARTRAELLDTRGPERPPLSLPDIQRLTAHLEALAEAVVPLRIDILHTYTGDLLDPCIRFEALAQGLDPAICHWPLADHGLAPRPDGRHQRSLDGLIRRDVDKVPVHAVDAAPASSA
jgi:hypothetical protein